MMMMVMMMIYTLPYWSKTSIHQLNEFELLKSLFWRKWRIGLSHRLDQTS